MKEEFKNINIRSEEVEEILGRQPGWIIRRGIMVVAIIILALVSSGGLFKYPEIIPAEITITSENIPVSLVAKSDGKIAELFVNDKQHVKEGDYLAIIENTANYSDVEAVRGKLDSLKPFISNLQQLLKCPVEFHFSYLLGDMQVQYSSFIKNYEDYKSFISEDYQNKQIASLCNQRSRQTKTVEELNRQQGILKQKLLIGENQYARDSALFSDKSIALLDYEKSKSSLLDDKYSFATALTTVSSAQADDLQLEQSIIVLEKEYAEKKKGLELLIKESYDNLRNMISLWEQTYVLKSPIDGIVAFSKYWSKNQHVVTGSNVITVIPEESSKIIGKLSLPIAGSGKVKTGQKVNISLDNYPYMEFGKLVGFIKSISLVPVDNTYIAEVEFPDGLKTTYGKSLVFGQEMHGSANVITEDIRLIERIFNPLRALVKN